MSDRNALRARIAEKIRNLHSWADVEKLKRIPFAHVDVEGSVASVLADVDALVALGGEATKDAPVVWTDEEIGYMKLKIGARIEALQQVARVLPDPHICGTESRPEWNPTDRTTVTTVWYRSVRSLIGALKTLPLDAFHAGLAADRAADQGSADVEERK